MPLLPQPRHLEQTGRPAPLDALPSVERDAALPAQGFELTIDGDVRVRAADDAGERYARACLEQIRLRSDGELRGLHIRDWPDFPVRGYMLDVSRDRVPTRETLERLVDLLDALRINQLQLYTEHTFAYAAHEVAWRDASPITHDDVRWLDALCRARGIELVANQNTFGHMARWLRHPEYAERAEAPDGWPSPLGGGTMQPTVLAPSDENAEFALALCRELLACHTSRRINIGCDETFELGLGRSRTAVSQRGKGRVYLDHLLRLMDGLLADGYQVLFWGDIMREHPQLIDALPKEGVTALAWHYEAPLDPDAIPAPLLDVLGPFGVTREGLRSFEAHAAPFGNAGFPFWVCPGTSTWNTLIGRLPNARGNLLDAARVGLAHGAGGYLITDWGDTGHMQPPSASFAPLAYGAAVSWCVERNADLDLATALDAFVFRDAAGELGAALEIAGAAYDGTGLRAFNGSPLFTELVGTGLIGALGEADEAGTRGVLDQLAEAGAAVERARPACVDADVVRRELLCALRLARHGAWRILRRAGFDAPPTDALRADLSEAIEEQRACWLLRSRPGGLRDSVARLETTLAEYAGT